MSFSRGNIAPEEMIGRLQERVTEERALSGKGRPIVLGRSILEPIDELARLRAREGRETIKTAKQDVISGQPLTTARDLCGNGGYVFTAHSPRIAWKRFPIPYFVDVGSSPVVDKIAVESAIDKAFNGYNVAYRTIKNNQTVLMFKRVMDPVLAKVQVRWQYLDGALRNLGRCYYSWWSTLPIGEMKSASINFDTADKWFISAVERCGYSGLYFDIQNIAMHEIGHAIGLAHNTIDTYSTMYPTSKAGETLRRSLGNADIKAMSELYKG